MRHFLNLSDLTKKELEKILKMASKDLKKDLLKSKVLGLLFEKKSTRTRLSFEVGMNHLGGNAIFLGKDDIHLGVNESLHDTTKVLGRFVDGVAARVKDHKRLEEMSKFSKIPIINALSNLSHPCQALADVLTIKQKLGRIKHRHVTFIGDGNNVCNSLIEAATIFNFNMTVICPKGYEPDRNFIELAKKSDILFKLTSKVEIPKVTDVIYTDTWVSMGNEKDKTRRFKTFKKYQVSQELFNHVQNSALFMHCLPAHRGKEVTDGIIDGPHSVVFDQAHNRLTTAKGLLTYLIK